jgi:hypothetical protein
VIRGQLPLPVSRLGVRPAVHDLLGTIDTVGGTTCDAQEFGPAVRTCANSRYYGLHVIWTYSAALDTLFPDLNTRYNFYDYASRGWNWIDPEYMRSGVNVRDWRGGFGNLETDYWQGTALMSGNDSGLASLRPVVARDIAPGAGIFEYANCSISAAYRWMLLAWGGDVVQCIVLADSSLDISTSRVVSWPNWEVPQGSFEPGPHFPSHNIAAARTNARVCVTWVVAELPAMPGFYRISTNSGVSWLAPQELTPPDVFGGDTMESWYVNSLYPFFDADDELHIVGNVAPVVGETLLATPSAIVHWCPSVSPVWSVVARAGCAPEHLAGGLGYGATYAGRPSIDRDPAGTLCCVWEQFDSLDVEPTTGLLRASVYVATLPANEEIWSPAQRVSDTGTASCRYPNVTGRAESDTTIAISYLIDQCAGSAQLGEGPLTFNPVVVRRIPHIAQGSAYQGRFAAPNDGDCWAGGSDASVIWSVRPRTFALGRLLFSTDGGTTYPQAIRENIPPQETSWVWYVPHDNYPACRLRFEALDSHESVVFRTSSRGCFAVDSDTPTAPGLIGPSPDTILPGRTNTFRWHRSIDTGGDSLYTIQLAYDSVFGHIAGTASTTDTFRSISLPADSVYWWRARAMDRLRRTGPWSNVWRFAVDAETPGAPIPLAPVGDTWLQSGDIVFHWTAVSFDGGKRTGLSPANTPVTYVVSIDTLRPPRPLFSETTAVTTDTIHLPYEAHYWWYVRAYDLAGHVGPYSTPVSFGRDTTPPWPPHPVFPGNGSTVGQDTTTLLWRRAVDLRSGVASYELQLARDSLFSDTVIVPTPNPLDTFRHAALPVDARYLWRVRAHDRAGVAGAWSPTWSFNSVAGIAGEDRIPARLRLLGPKPNPSGRAVQFLLELPKSSSVHTVVLNAAGQTIRTICSGAMGAGRHELNWDGRTDSGRETESGIYFVRVYAAGLTFNRRFVRLH